MRDLHSALSESPLNAEKLGLALVNISSHKDMDITKVYFDTYAEDLWDLLKEKLTEDVFKAAEYLFVGYLKASALLLNEAIIVSN